MTLRQSNVPIRSSQGEFLLSREIGDLAASMPERFLLSTYSVTPDTVYVQVQLVQLWHNFVRIAQWSKDTGSVEKPNGCDVPISLILRFLIPIRGALCPLFGHDRVRLPEPS